MRWPASTVALIALVATLGSTTAALVWAPLDVKGRMARRVIVYPAPATPNRSAEPGLMILSTLRTAPVFYRSRETIPAEDPAAIAASQPQYILIAALIGPAGAGVAYVRGTSAKDAVHIHAGDRLDGWVVKAIELKRVVVARGGLTAEILPLAKPPTAGLTRVASAAALPASTGTHILTAHGTGTPAYNAPEQSSSEARTYRAPQPFSTAPRPGT